jgi:hypothetical protein
MSKRDNKTPQQARREARATLDRLRRGREDWPTSEADWEYAEKLAREFVQRVELANAIIAAEGENA